MEKRTLEEIEAIEKVEAKEPVEALLSELSELSKQQFTHKAARSIWTGQVRRLTERLNEMLGVIDRHGELPHPHRSTLVAVRLAVKDMQNKDSNLNKLLRSLEAKVEK